jgi:hypothetical protein
MPLAGASQLHEPRLRILRGDGPLPLLVSPFELEPRIRHRLEFRNWMAALIEVDEDVANERVELGKVVQLDLAMALAREREVRRRWRGDRLTRRIP